MIEASDPRRCARCKAEKALAEFSRNRAQASSYDSYCKPCKAAETRAARARNPEQYRAKQREYLRRYYPEHAAQYAASQRRRWAARKGPPETVDPQLGASLARLRESEQGTDE